MPTPSIHRLVPALLCLLLALPTLAYAPDPTTTPLPMAAPPANLLGRKISFFSASLGRTLPFWLYLPPGYATTPRRYPVLYLLHGRDASCGQWRELGLFARADALIRAGVIAPMVIVAPEGEFGYWMNHADGGPRWGDYVLELVQHIDSHYHTLPTQAHRAIGGISMGGHGALQLALNHPGTFAAVGGHSAVFRREAEAPAFFGHANDYRQRDPLSLLQARTAPPDFALWLDIGADDPWVLRATTLHSLLTQRGIPHNWQIGPGGHDSAYWQAHLDQYLQWYDSVLHSNI